MTRLARREYATALQERYRAATKPDNGGLLDEFCQTPAESTSGHRQGDQKAAPLVGTSDGPDSPPVGLHQGFDQRQPDP